MVYYNRESLAWENEEDDTFSVPMDVPEAKLMAIGGCDYDFRFDNIEHFLQWYGEYGCMVNVW